jgi:hypothetical protein
LCKLGESHPVREVKLFHDYPVHRTLVWCYFSHRSADLGRQFDVDEPDESNRWYIHD